MTINVKGPDGSDVAFPDGTPQADIISAMDAHFGQKGEAPSLVEGMVRAAGTGVPIFGGLLNKADAATNAALAPVLNPLFSEGDQLKGDTFGERYANALKIQEGLDKKFGEEHPIVNTAANIGGGIAALAPVGATATGAKLLGLGGKSLMGSVGRSAVSGAALNAADAAIRGEDPQTGALVGGLTGAAAPVVGQAIGKAYNAVAGAPKMALPGADDIKAAAEAGFNSVRGADVHIKPDAVANVAQQTEQSLLRQGIKPYLAEKTFRALGEMQDIAPGATATFDDLHGMRRVFGAIAGSTDPTERKAASTAIGALDDYLKNIPTGDVIKGDAAGASQLFNESLANYAAMKRLGLISGKMDAADLQASSANSGANIDNAIRQRIKQILLSPSQRRGFNQDELLQMQKIVKGTSTGNVLRTVGNLLGGGGGLGALISGGAGYAAAGPQGVLAPLAGYVVKKAGNALTRAQVDELNNMIASRAPASASVLLQNQLANAKNEAQRQQIQKIFSLMTRGATPALANQ